MMGARMRADQRLGNAYGIVLCCLVLADCSQHEPQRGDDQALEAQYAEIVGKLGNLLLPGEHEHEYETCISEMVRRGGEH